MDTGDAHPMNIDEESDYSVEEIGNLTQSEGAASTSRPKKQKRKLTSGYMGRVQVEATKTESEKRAAYLPAWFKANPSGFAMAFD
ncbi:hypothetical protein Tco_1082412 [Tanacetum coccineum]|uniref:Uncharacterized protein n=1 Tax=Tanacetum coccineum TaxID=301880 RepID=A0ABQ5I207_9ASTR